MIMKGWISREEENNFPSFKSHDEAMVYLSERYGEENFHLIDIIQLDEKIYCYRYIINKEIYEAGYKKMLQDSSKGILIHETDFDYLESYQPVEIHEDGSIHCIH